MILKKLFILIILISSISVSADNKNVWFYINNGAGSDIKAMGGAGVAVSNYASSGYWNPSNIAGFVDNRIRGSFIYTHFLPLSNYTYFSISQKVTKWGAISLNWHNFNVGNINKDNQNNVISVMYAKEVELGISTGISLKYYYQLFQSNIYTNFGIDIGLTYQPKGSLLKIGLVFKDMLTELVDETISIGFSYPLIINKFLFVSSLSKTINQKWKIHAGAEYTFNFFKIRIGIDDKKPAAGFGIGIFDYYFDYSYTYISELDHLKYTHRFSINYTF